MKIDFVVGSLRAGGAERVVSVLANYFAKKGNEVRIITFMDGDEYDLFDEVKRVKYHKKLYLFNYVPVKAFFFFLYYYFKKSNRPDVISSHIDVMGIATIPVAKTYGIKIVVSEHFNHFNQKVTPAKLILWNFIYRFPNAITILTKYDLSFFKDKNRNVIVMPNPCSFTPLKNLKKSREKVILAIGDLNRYHHKGFDNLIEIGVEVLKSNPEWKLKLVGGGEEGLKYLTKKLKAFNVNDQIIFAGYRTDVKDLMAKSEIFILSSRREGLPLVLIEAMSQGMVCISYDCISGPSDIITNNVDGILVSDQNKEEMTKKLNELIINSELREYLRANTTKSLEKFSIETVGGKWEKLFNSFFK